MHAHTTRPRRRRLGLLVAAVAAAALGVLPVVAPAATAAPAQPTAAPIAATGAQPTVSQKVTGNFQNNEQVLFDSTTGKNDCLSIGSTPTPLRGGYPVTVNSCTPGASNPTGVLIHLQVLHAVADGTLDVFPSNDPSQGLPPLPFKAGDNLTTVMYVVPLIQQDLVFRSSVQADLIVWEDGYYYNPANFTGSFQALTPERVLDTRNGTGLQPGSKPGLVPGGTSIDVNVAGSNVGADATSVVINLSAVNAQTQAFVTAYPKDAPRPGTSSVNAVQGDQPVSNVVVVGLTDGQFTLYTNGTTNLFVDVLGYFHPAPGGVSSAGRFGPLNPVRILDTRHGLGTTNGKMAPGGIIKLQVLGQGNVPAAGVSAVVLGVTATNTAGPGYITVWPTGQKQPNASNLNPAVGQNIASLVIVPVGVDGTVSLFSYAGTDLLADVEGYFTDASAPPSDTGLFVALPQSQRLMDTREPGQGGPFNLVQAHPNLTPGKFIGAGVPVNAPGVWLNVTATNTQDTGYVTVWGAGTPQPVASNLNFQPVPVRSVAAAVLSPLSPDGVNVAVGGSPYGKPSADIVVDVSGYFQGVQAQVA